MSVRPWTPTPVESPSVRYSALGLLVVAVALSVGAAVIGVGAGAASEALVIMLLVTVWALAGLCLLIRRPRERLGLLLLGWSALAAAGSLATVLLREHPGRAPEALVRALVVALLPAAALQLVLSLPDGRLSGRGDRMIVAAAYACGAVVGLALWTERPTLPLWPIGVEVVLVAVGLAILSRRHREATGMARRRLQWACWAALVAAAIALAAASLHVLGGWPPDVALIAAAATLLIPLALVAGAAERPSARIETLLSGTIVLVGLSALVVGIYFAVVLGLGRPPRGDERTVLLLSVLATGLAVLVAGPVRGWLAERTGRFVQGSQRPSEEALRTFGARLSRAIPLDELLLQLAESLRGSLTLAAAEIWTGSDGVLERAASDPERGTARLVLDAAAQEAIAGGGVAGARFVDIWLPGLHVGRQDGTVRVVPIASTGELLGLIVVESSPEQVPLDEDAEQLLKEIARQVGLALRNVRLDSALQASLADVGELARELRDSRTRIVLVADAERRRIERDLHDGAQQHLVALSVNLRLARELAHSDPAQAEAVLDELAVGLQDVLDEVRRLAHGIYPPLLLDRGLAEALTAAVARSPPRARVEVTQISRHPPEVEATVYFCCLEALQNAAKHAGSAACVSVRLWEEAGALRFAVADDGAGFDSARRTRGAGLTNMADRLGAIGGSLRVESGLGRGTVVRGAIPLAR